MEKDFNKFRRRLLLENTIKSVLISVACSLLITGLLFWITAMCNYLFHWAVYAGCGVGIFVVLLIISLIVIKPTDKDIALRVDNELNLNERTATMIEFKDEYSLLIDKQRRDAEEKLHKNSPKMIKLKVFSTTIPALLFSGSFFTASMFTPMIKHMINDKITDIDKVDDIVDKKIEEGASLIIKSGAAKDLQEELLKILDNLQSELEGDESIDSRQAKVDAAKLKVDATVNKANSSDEIGVAFDNALNEKSYGELGELLRALQVAITDVNKSETIKALTDLREFVLGTLKDDGIYLSILTAYPIYADTISKLTECITNALTISKISLDNALYLALNTFQKNLSTISEALKSRHDEIENNVDEDDWTDKGMGTREAYSKTKDVFDTCIKELGDALGLEETNTNLGEEIKKLMDQLVNPDKTDESGNDTGTDDENNGENKDNPDDDENQNNNGSGTDDDQNNNGQNNEDNNNNGNNDNGNGNENGNSNEGSGNSTSDDTNTGDGKTNGSGKTNYGGNDKVFVDGESQEYGQVIDKEQGEAMSDSDGTDLSDAVSDYYDALYGNEGKQKP